MPQDQLSDKICEAFKGVLLEKGIGLWEGQSMDDYEVGISRLEARAKDEKVKLPVQ